MKMVAAAFEGNFKYKSLFLLQTAYTAFRPPGAVIDCILKIA